MSVKEADKEKSDVKFESKIEFARKSNENDLVEAQTDFVRVNADNAKANCSTKAFGNGNHGDGGQESQGEIITLPTTLQERFFRIKQLVKSAIAEHHTFMIYGKSKVIRECLLKRGWCEKLFRKQLPGEQHLNVESSSLALMTGIGDLKDIHSERQLISRMLSNHTVDFLWNTGAEWPGWPSQDNKTTIFNRYNRAAFTSKVGLCANVRQMHWYYEAGIANTLFPRCYNICQGDQLHAFVEDFRFTACLSLLKWLVSEVNEKGEIAVRSSAGAVPLKALDFAIKRCSDFIAAQFHDDIDQEAEKIWPHQWEQFISWYYKIVQGQSVFVKTNVPFEKYMLASKHILKKVRKYWPQLDMDGVLNIWILKPGNKSRGRGIVLVNKLEDVMNKVNPANKSDSRFVVQKYIERPFLIYNTKFDIRQWFIVTNAQPLVLWMYKESYLRFCSQKFDLANFHESIHLCNNAIQCKYTNSEDRDPKLPEDNMWDATTFKELLSAQGHPDVWDKLIYPGMKQSLVGSLLASQEAMDKRKNSFELYGADFMIMDDFSVWLIEINSHPDMSYSTSVTTRLCKQVMDDTLKVVVDYREDKNAKTGDFELVYRQRLPSCQPYLGAALSLHGTKIATNDKKLSELSMIESKSNTTLKPSPSKAINIGPVIVDLIEELEIHLDKEFYTFLHARETSSPALPSSSVEIGNISSAPGNGKTDDNDINSVQLQETKKSTATKKSAKAAKGPVVNKKPSKSAGPSNRPARQILISNVINVQKPTTPLLQSKPSQEKVKAQIKHNKVKIINSAIREAVNKYKRKTALENSAQQNSLNGGKGSSKDSSRSGQKSRQRRKKVLVDISDTPAVLATCTNVE